MLNLKDLVDVFHSVRSDLAGRLPLHIRHGRQWPPMLGDIQCVRFLLDRSWPYLEGCVPLLLIPSNLGAAI
jgi:hypothetical protein